jgi:hypothetical protein
LAYDVAYRQLSHDFTSPISADHVDKAAETLKLGMNVHIDSLMARLHEPRVKRIMSAVLTGSHLTGPDLLHDLNYCLDIGIIKKTSQGKYSTANRIYADVIIHLLTFAFQAELPDGL